MDTNTTGTGGAPDKENNQSVEKHVESAFQSLHKDYSLVGKRHIRAWKAWLAIGLVVGIATGVILVANRSGEVEGGKAFQEVDGAAGQELPAVETARLSPKIVYRTQICDRPACYWEMVFAGHPTDPKKLFLADAQTRFLSRSVDAGRTWIAEDINVLAGHPAHSIQGAVDPKMVVIKDGKLYFSVISYKSVQDSTVERVGILYQGGSQGALAHTFFQDVIIAPESLGATVDRPNMVVDDKSGTIYISADAWHESLGTLRNTLFISRDGGITFSKDSLGEFVNKGIMTLGADGKLYEVSPGSHSEVSPQLLRFTSFEPPAFDVLPLQGYVGSTVRLDTTSTERWQGYGGPEVVADTAKRSPHRGRLYIVWAQHEKIIWDSPVVDGSYGFNLDVFVNYSDDRGETWSLPVRVNDDSGTGDQFFPSARVDEWGRLHVAFVDHRDNQDKPVFDVYYAFSADGVHFSKNFKITDTPTQNDIHSFGAAQVRIGDYLDMVMPYKDRVYVAYPCGSHPDGRPAGACMVEIRLSKSKPPVK